ncbi:sensor histidine kinase, partial [Candidatus Omnitrophota bacterium]
KQIEVEIYCKDRAVFINISDRGIGVPSGDVKKIFGEFYRADDSLTSRARGTGLGLTIAHRIIRDHNGDIQLFAREGGGSTFQITLPIIEEQS